jgi:hypothetical protein
VKRIALPALLSAGLLLVSACGSDRNLTGVATSENTVRRISAYALSGTPASLPAAYLFTNETLVRPQLLPSGSVNFEVAFDIGENGQVLLLPARVVVPEAPLPAPAVGIQRSTLNFASVIRAPDRDYVRDSTFTGQVGDTFLLQLLNSGCTFGQPVYAKLAIDSVLVAERRVVFSSMVNRNCGFRSLQTGLPRD